jgi:hypothetical protein
MEIQIVYKLNTTYCGFVNNTYSILSVLLDIDDTANNTFMDIYADLANKATMPFFNLQYSSLSIG